MDESLLEWASEAMLADADGYLDFGRLLLRSTTTAVCMALHPITSTRHDSAESNPPHIDPMYYWSSGAGWPPPWRPDIAMLRDYTWRERDVVALRRSYR